MKSASALTLSASDSQVIPLTGIRFIAAACVIWFHYLTWLTPFKGGVPSFLQVETFKYGMTLFFVLSGFVIHLTYSPLFERETPLKAIYGFAVARFARLYPLYLAFLFFCILRVHGNLDRLVDDPQFRGFFILHLLGVQSWLPFTLDGNIASNSLFHVSWSISTELFFYWVYPLAFLLIRRIASYRAAILTFVLYSVFAYAGYWVAMHNIDAMAAPFGTFAASSYVGANNAPPYWLSYVSPYLRFPEFVAGALAAQAFSLKEKNHNKANATWRYCAYFGFPAAFAGLLMSQYWSPFANFLSQNFLIAPVIALFLLFVAVDKDSVFARILSFWPLFVLGEVSYSLYLLHPMLTRLIDIPLNTYELSFQGWLQFVASFATLAAILCALSIGVYMLWEKPARRWVRSIARGVVKA